MLFSVRKNNIVSKKCVSGNTNVSTNQDAVLTSLDRVPIRLCYKNDGTLTSYTWDIVNTISRE